MPYIFINFISNLEKLVFFVNALLTNIIVSSNFRLEPFFAWLDNFSTLITIEM